MARRGTNNITVRMDADLWGEFGALADDRSALLRQFVEWYVRRPGAKRPSRPTEVDRTDDGDQGSDMSRSAP